MNNKDLQHWFVLVHVGKERNYKSATTFIEVALKKGVISFRHTPCIRNLSLMIFWAAESKFKVKISISENSRWWTNFFDSVCSFGFIFLNLGNLQIFT